jgi:acetyl-CoA carboxylase biotin carboxyl carrier protein
MKETVEALVLPGDEPDDRIVAAPTVGRYLMAPPVGTYLAPGAEAGILRVLRRQFRLVVPAGDGGTVKSVLVAGRAAPVERGQPLLSLTRGALAVEGSGGEDAPSAARDEDVPEGMIAVRSPTDGIFYRRPSPEEPAYVSEGEEVERGKVLGLVEVMKCFNQIAFTPDDAVSRATVARVVPEDAGEVKLGQVHFLLEPV